MTSVIDQIAAEQRQGKTIPEFSPGDTIRVDVRVTEGTRSRLQAFEGFVLATHGGTNPSFTVRKISYGVGVERVFPLYSPIVENIEVIRHGKVRRAKLYYMRGLTGKAARITEDLSKRAKKASKKAAAVGVETVSGPVEAATPKAAAAPKAEKSDDESKA